MLLTGDARSSTSRRDRVTSAVAVALVHAALAYALLAGLSVDLLRPRDGSLTLFDVPPTSRAPARPSPIPRGAANTGRAAPPALRAAPSPIVAPAPVVSSPPPPLRAAPVAGAGDRSAAGAASRTGPGVGAGGGGDGSGAGGDGSGAGGPGLLRRAERIAGELRNRDYPRGAVHRRDEGEVIVHLSIGADGRVADCAVARSSGSPDLDTTTCELITERFRYRAALDRSGRPVPDLVGWRQSWWLAR